MTIIETKLMSLGLVMTLGLVPNAHAYSDVVRKAYMLMNSIPHKKTFLVRQKISILHVASEYSMKLL